MNNETPLLSGELPDQKDGSPSPSSTGYLARQPEDAIEAATKTFYETWPWLWPTLKGWREVPPEPIEAAINAWLCWRKCEAEQRVAVASTDWLGKATIRQLSGLLKKLIGKDWFAAWDLHDVCFLIRRARHAEPCQTCNGSGYQGASGHPSCQVGCEDCAATGLCLPRTIDDMHATIQDGLAAARKTPEYEQEGRELKKL